MQLRQASLLVAALVLAARLAVILHIAELVLPAVMKHVHFLLP